MTENLPTYIPVVFALTTMVTLILFYLAIKFSPEENTARKANTAAVMMTIWLSVQAAITWLGIYHADLMALPPRIMLFGVLPALLVIVAMFATHSGRQFIDSLSLKHIHWLHIVRIPVEIVLLWLFLHDTIPQLMTFEGRNFDIISGITAPLIAYFGFTKQKLSREIILAWNFICLALLFNIVINALLAAPTPLQQFAFDQPNVAIFYFPYSWLPTFVVPVVLFCHLVAIRQLWRVKSDEIRVKN